MNIFCIVGQIEELPNVRETPSGDKVGQVVLRVERPFANAQGQYEYDKVQIEVWRGLAETISNVSKVDDFISVKGRISTRIVEKEGHTYYNYAFVAEKIGFLHP